MEKRAIFNRFRNTEYLQFFEDVGAICKKVDVVALKLEPQVNELAQVTLVLSNNFKQQQASEFTLSLSELDTRRDIDINLIRKVSVAYSYHFNPDKARAARLVVRCIDKYGKGISKMNYQAQTTVLSNLGKDLKQPEEAAAVELLGLTDVVDNMIALNTQFNTQYLNRVDEKADDDDVKTAELIKEALVKWDQLETFIEANEVLNPSEELTALVNKLSELIEAYNNTVSSRGKKNESVQ